MAKIAISYRRSDSQDITGRIFDRLIQRFGRETVFRDIDSIVPGVDFRDQIAEALATTSVLVSVVGPRWRGPDETAANRLDNEADPVRIEVEMAMRRTIPIIPVLVGGAAMPAPSELPEPIKDFAYRHAVSVDGGRDFDHHVNGLIHALEYFLRREADLQEPQAPPAAPAENASASIVGGAAAAGEAAVAQAAVGVALPEGLAPPPPPRAARPVSRDELPPAAKPKKRALRRLRARLVGFCKFMIAPPGRRAPIPILLCALRYLAIVYVAVLVIAALVASFTG